MKNSKPPPHSASLLRELPPIHRLVAAPALHEFGASLPSSLITKTAQEVLDEARRAILNSPEDATPTLPSFDELTQRIAERLHRLEQPSLRGAINATGVVLHTGLGRARLSEAACAAIAEVARGHSLVEIEAESGQRGSRQDHVQKLLRELTGAEEALVLNNCAGAVFLAVSALATGREVIISRGELVEIGGAFRIPDIIRSSGATLVEVGTTNRTRLSDYADAITERTGLILRCHPSNFAIVGFTEEVPTPELAALAHDNSLPFIEDQGNGALFPLDTFGITGVKGSLVESVSAGCDVVTASGDKLLGATQSGILLGKREPIRRIAKHPLARALRVDKLTLAGLEATLRLYRNPEQAQTDIPTLRYLTRQEPELRRMAQSLARGLRRILDKERFAVEVVKESSQVGGGSLPNESLPTLCVRVRCLTDSPTVNDLAKTLRQSAPPIFGRIRSDALLLDPRTLELTEIPLIVAAFQRI